MRCAVAILALLLLAACGNPYAPSQAQVEKALAGVGAAKFREDVPEPGSPLPRSFQVRRAFELANVAPKGGQYFICDTRRNCDAIAAYFDALKALAGPYTYQSDSGLVVVQLNSGLSPAEAAAIAQAVKGL